MLMWRREKVKAEKKGRPPRTLSLLWEDANFIAERTHLGVTSMHIMRARAHLYNTCLFTRHMYIYNIPKWERGLTKKKME